MSSTLLPSPTMQRQVLTTFRIQRGRTPEMALPFPIPSTSATIIPPPLHKTNVSLTFLHPLLPRRGRTPRRCRIASSSSGGGNPGSCRTWEWKKRVVFGLVVGEEEDEESESESVVMDSPDRWDVLGLGQAMVDFSGMVDDEFLERVGLKKGTRGVVNHEERGRILQAMDGCDFKAAAGGSLSNTLVALARLGGRSLNIAMAGSVGGDPLSEFYRAKLKRANVNFLSNPIKDGTTGTVIVLTTPDAQRTMLAYPLLISSNPYLKFSPGTSSVVNYDSCLASLISKANVLVIEGYLFELPHTKNTILKACEHARSNGTLIAVTGSDVSCIQRYYDNFWEIIKNYADILFANSDEARAFCQFSSKDSTVSSTRYLSHFVSLVSITHGCRGSYIGVKGEAIYVPPSPCLPVDTCGAGDAYASGILYSILKGSSDLKEMGMLASRVAATVVGQQGTRLGIQDAERLAESFSSNLDFPSINSDVESDHISSC